MVKLVSQREAEEASVVSVKAGDYLFREGDPAQDMVLVQEGSIELLKKQAEGEARLAVLEPGDFCGEGSLLEGTPRECSARVAAAGKVLRIDGPTLLDLLRREPEIALRMLRRLSRRLSRSLETAAPRPKKAVAPAAAAAAKAAPPPAKPAVPARARLVHASGDEFPLPPDHDALVGRADPTSGFAPDVVLSSLDAQRSLSRRHATIVRKGDEFFVREEPGVRNGTFVNGKRVKAGSQVTIKDGDEVSFGLIKTTFRVG